MIFNYFYLYFIIKELPVICSGFSKFIIYNIVGAISANLPSSFNLEDFKFSPTAINGTGFVECAVIVVFVSGSYICSALPWSAVISACPPLESILSTTFPTHVSTVSTAFIAASTTPVCPTISGLA